MGLGSGKVCSLVSVLQCLAFRSATILSNNFKVSTNLILKISDKTAPPSRIYQNAKSELSPYTVSSLDLVSLGKYVVTFQRSFSIRHCESHHCVIDIDFRKKPMKKSSRSSKSAQN